MTYDRSSDGWAYSGPTEHATRPAEERVRCGMYLAPEDSSPSWGDHRVTYPGTTCEAVDCHVAHHPTVAPGWPEPGDADFYTRPGAKAIGAALYGWDGAGHMRERLGDIMAWNAAHIALDALRDAGYTIIPPDPAEGLAGL